MRRLPLLLTAALLFATAACGGSDDTKASSNDSVPGLHVSGAFGSAPTVRIDKPVKVKELHTDVIIRGSGDEVRLGSKALLNLYIANGKSGKKAISTYDRGQPLNATMDETQFFPPLVDALKGMPSGSRVAFADTVKDLYGAAGAKQIGLKASDSLVFVVDVMSATPTNVLDKAQGTVIAPPAHLPRIVTRAGKIRGFDFTKAAKRPSSKLRVITLVKGTGEPIHGQRIVQMNFVGEVYGRKKPFSNSFTASQPGSFVVGDGQLIPAWDKVLQGQRVGTRLMLLVPPAQGYGKAGQPQIHVTGKSTLVFVMDILGVG